MRNIDWQSVRYFVVFGVIVFCISMVVGAIGGLLVR